MINLKKIYRTVSVYLPYKQFVSERFEFRSDFGTYTVNLSDDLQYMTRTFE